MKKITLYQKLKKDFPAVPEKELYAQILCGEVLVDEQIIRDPKFPVDTETGIILNPKKYVSRGGFKLEKAIELWKPSLEGRIVLDAGCSTGGFTDCLLKNGAASVYAVDVGYNQLDYSLRTNPSVVVMEKHQYYACSGSGSQAGLGCGRPFFQEYPFGSFSYSVPDKREVSYRSGKTSV